MLQSRIALTEHILSNIKAARTAKRIPAATLAKAINRDASYISSMELGRLRKISSHDLVAIMRVLYDIPEHEAIAKVEGLINEDMYSGNTTDTVPQSPMSGMAGTYEMTVNERAGNYISNNAHADYAQTELIRDMLDVMDSLLIDIYRKDPKEAVFSLQSFIKTLQFDSEFAMGIMEMPFYALKTMSGDERKKVLDELMRVLKTEIS